jgi:excisionase family DNA binding protein
MPRAPSRFEFVYDPEHDTLTVWLAAEGRTARAVTHGQDCILDFDSRGGLMSVEILNASRYYSPAELRSHPLPTEEELTLAEAAAESGLSVETLRGQIRNGRLPATKRGRDWLVTGRALVAYAESRSPRGRMPASRKAARARREQKKVRAASHPGE